MKKNYLLIALLFVCLAILLPSNQSKISKYHSVDFNDKFLSSVNPPAARTGAPGESNCTVSCHSGSTQSSAGIIDVTFSGAGNEYMVGQTYTFTISIAAGAKNGFEATILDNTDTKAGTFTSGTNYSVTTSAGRQYARHSVSAGVTTWTINWTAPATDVGDLTMYFAFNQSNNLGNSSGDIIYLGQFNVASAAFNTITDYERADEQIKIWYGSSEMSLNYSYHLNKPADVVLSIQDLSGKLIAQNKLGEQPIGLHETKFSLVDKPMGGIYIVSLLIDNNVYNRKIYIP